jgi:pyruvate formate lyase activating enzyme
MTAAHNPPEAVQGWVFNVERFTLHDGPGIRTTVFLKGCPLRCLWCSNPESQERAPELTYFPDKCTSCGRCLDVCPQDALSRPAPDEPVVLDYARCDACGKCLEVCYPEALVMVGEQTTASSVAEMVARDKPFYTHSGGGVTLSGGEPLAQSRFAAEILRLCKEQGIHTVIQSSGLASTDEIDRVLAHLDLAIIDMKHIDSAVHQRLTGVKNERILNNIRYIDASGCSLVIQVPLIPGYNDSDEVLTGICQFAAGLKNLVGISLLSYHALGVMKYSRLGRDYQLQDLAMPDKAYLEERIHFCEQFSIPIVRFNG